MVKMEGLLLEKLISLVSHDLDLRRLKGFPNNGRSGRDHLKCYSSYGNHDLYRHSVMDIWILDRSNC